MKKKQFNAKLSLNKTTIANLSKEDLRNQHGGNDDISVVLCQATETCTVCSDDCAPPVSELSLCKTGGGGETNYPTSPDWCPTADC